MAVRIRILKRYNFVAKVENEILVFGRVIHAKKIQQQHQFGPGANTIDSLDALFS